MQRAARRTTHAIGASLAGQIVFVFRLKAQSVERARAAAAHGAQLVPATRPEACGRVAADGGDTARAAELQEAEVAAAQHAHPGPSTAVAPASLERPSIRPSGPHGPLRKPRGPVGAREHLDGNRRDGVSGHVVLHRHLHIFFTVRCVIHTLLKAGV